MKQTLIASLGLGYEALDTVFQFLDAVVIGVALTLMGLLVVAVLVGHTYNAWLSLTGKQAYGLSPKDEPGAHDR